MLRLFGVLIVASALCLAAKRTPAQSITIGTVSGSPGETVSVPVTIQVPSSITEGVAGTQTDITFDPVNAPIGTVCLLDNTVKCTTDQDCITASGDSTDKCNVPDCTPNTAIKKESTQFAFLPPGCSGSTCTGIRTLVFSQTAAQANRPIPDGSVLYTCNVKVAATASGTIPLTISNVVMSKPSNSGCGRACAITGATGVNGSIVISGGRTPTPTASPPVTGPPAIIVGSASGTPGQNVSIAVTIQVPASITEGVSGTQNDITFDRVNVPIGRVCLLDNTVKCSTDQDCVSASGDPTDKCNVPDCTPNTAINKESTQFAFQPPGCSGSTCTGIRTLVFSQTAAQANRPIPNGSVLYTCNIKIVATAPAGSYPLTITNVVMSKPANSGCGTACAITGAVGVNGWVTVTRPTPTPTLTAPTPTGPAIIVGSGSGSPGQTVPVPVTIRVPASITEGVAGTQNDITSDPANVPIGTVCLLDNTVKCSTDQDCITASGDSTDKCNVPDCTPNTAIKKESTQFAFQPPACDPTIGACTGIRALVFSQTAAQANRPIPDGSVLYTCNFKIAATAPAGSYPLTISNVVMSKPANSGCGTACAITGATGVNGWITVIRPTPTPTPTAPTPTAPTPTGPPAIIVGSASGSPGQSVPIAVTIHVPASIPEGVAGTQNDITSDPVNVPIGRVCLLDNAMKCSTDQDCVTASGDSTDKCNVPDCTPNTAIKKESTQFAFQPPGCDPIIGACTGMRALVFSQTAAQANRPIPDGSVLYTCNFKIAATAPPGTYPLTISNVVMSDTTSRGCGTACAIPATGVNGWITVIRPTPTPTASRTFTATGTATPPITTTPPNGLIVEVYNTAIAPGQQAVPIPILLTNPVEVRGVQLTLTNLPDQVTLSGATQCATSSRAANLVCSAHQVGNDIRFVLLALGTSGIDAGSGPIAYIYVDDNTPSCSPGSTTQLTLTNPLVADANNDALPATTADGSLLCSCKGDSDGNGPIDVFDALNCVDFVIHRRTASPTQQAVTDLTCDGSIDIFDCLRIVDIMLGRVPMCPACAG